MHPPKQLIFFFLFMLYSNMALAALNTNENREEQPVRGIRYETRISGEMEGNILQALTQISDTKGLEERPPLTLTQLHRRARADVQEFSDAFRSFGFYAPQIDYRIVQDRTPVLVEFLIDPGPEYLIQEVNIHNICPEMTPLPDLPSPEQLNLAPGTRIRSAGVHEAMKIILEHVREMGHPFPFVEIDRVVIDHSEHRAYIDYNLDPGPVAVFGRTEVAGLTRVKEEYIFKRLPWKTGDPFKASLMRALRRQLTASGLFTLVDVTHAPELENDNQLPIKVNLTERSPRTARAGLAYQSDIGPELKRGWVHRNLRGQGEVLEFDILRSDIKKSAEAGYTIPGWLRPDQKLVFKSGLVQESPDAFDSDSAFVTAMLERALTDKLTAGIGLGYRLSRVKQLGETSEMGLFFIPLELSFDGRDDILDPGTGIHINIRAAPFFDTFEPDNRFVKTYASVSTYLELMSQKRIVLANRAAVGTISAEHTSKVPPDERFYSGGGGSVRGYSFQSAGHLEDGRPVGGLSLAEINNELRFKVTRRSGLAAFVDAGRAYDTWYPDLDERLFWAWGLGYRYYTDFGPIRLDVAFPINRRSRVDDSFQVYISLGQPF